MSLCCSMRARPPSWSCTAGTWASPTGRWCRGSTGWTWARRRTTASARRSSMRRSSPPWRPPDPAATKAMASYGYRVLLIRECTLAVEFPDTIGDLTHTRVATRYLEAWVGCTIGLQEYLVACRAVGDAALAGAGRQGGGPAS